MICKQMLKLKCVSVQNHCGPGMIVARVSSGIIFFFFFFFGVGGEASGNGCGFIYFLYKFNCPKFITMIALILAYPVNYLHVIILC